MGDTLSFCPLASTVYHVLSMQLKLRKKGIYGKQWNINLPSCDKHPLNICIRKYGIFLIIYEAGSIKIFNKQNWNSGHDFNIKCICAYSTLDHSKHYLPSTSFDPQLLHPPFYRSSSQNHIFLFCFKATLKPGGFLSRCTAEDNFPLLEFSNSQRLHRKG